MNRNKRNSIILIVVLLSIALTSLLLFLTNKEETDKVLITINGKKYNEYSLSKNQTITIKIGSEYNVISIEDKVVKVIESNCDNQICVNSYPISKDFPGLIVCLPHGLVIELKDQD